ncbi:B12-binding domain-containing radical SAM protein [Thermoproteus tenax]|uniref:Radical SAM superfamily enzyme n=1 Tax=Thermoproteus tenax (strain ATCC 35583 / DSM 2078 / JCM 9277 / NBRC 100435 / Kra 1) TaxID=768679 RepID=G4RM89_THETK|nr:radical SAM protein [Thermoproteus tenax]CCC82684.1 Radical SAM superfamily enzyme [Thermoproteus tenax Kra 1]
MPWEIVLTADRGSFTDYGGSTSLGYIADMPARLVPRLFMDKFFTPPISTDRDGRAIYAPYALRKVEAILASSGYTDVAVVPPERLRKAVGPKTKVVGISVHDPYGLSPVGTFLTTILGGGETWTARFFRELGETIEQLKRKYNVKVITGGPGVEQLLRAGKPSWIDVLFIDDVEITLPKWLPKIMAGEEVPPVIRPSVGEYPAAEDIPAILNPARLGEVQITRGCPRGCQFCSVTPVTFRSIPIETIVKEVEVNLRAGWTQVDLITDDLLLYGTSAYGPDRLKVNHNAIVRLYQAIRSVEVGRRRVKHIFFSHVSAAPVVESPKTVKAVAELGGLGPDKGVTPVIGLETGSVRILNKYMRNKAYPFPPERWHDVVLESAIILNENYIYPAYTMTIGYPDETEDDLRQSEEVVEKIIDHDLVAWIFPLPVIPMYTSALRGLRHPTLEALPEGFWDLLYISWRHNLKITRRLAPVLLQNSKNKIVSKIVHYMIDRVFNSIEWYFRQLKETMGRSSLQFSTLNLDSALGVLRSILWLTRISFGLKS